LNIENLVRSSMRIKYTILAFKCYWMEEDEFVDVLIEKHEEKKRLVNFLEQEGSLLTNSFRDKSSIFSVRNVTGKEMD
jgi:hypothetical protein